MATPTFAVRHKEPVLVRPAVPTPQETKLLSDIDNQAFLRRYVPMVFFYRGGRVQQANGDRDPVAVVRQALARALVPYYPLAGRLRELDRGELVMDCNSEGVLFVEADADVRLAELEAAGLTPPLPYLDQLLVNAKGFGGGVVNRPLLLVQVTRLLCGGFVVGIHVCHSICDGVGNAQFLSAVTELARGFPSPTILPAWSRELLRTTRRLPSPRPSTAVHKSRSSRAPATPPGSENVTRTFTFGSREIAAIKACLAPHLLRERGATTFELLMAALWRARTAALDLRPEEQVSLWFYCNLRGVRELGLPAGYYGNALIVAAVVTTAGELLDGSLGDAVELVRKAKAAVTTAEYVRSTTDPLKSGWEAPKAFRVSDVRFAGFHSMDFGWGEPVYGGRTDAPHGMSFFSSVNNNGGGGENAVAVSIVLPRAAMDRLAAKVKMLLTQPPVAAVVSSSRQARL